LRSLRALVQDDGETWLVKEASFAAVELEQILSCRHLTSLDLR